MARECWFLISGHLTWGMQLYHPFCGVTVMKVSKCQRGHVTVSNDKSPGEKGVGFFFLFPAAVKQSGGKREVHSSSRPSSILSVTKFVKLPTLQRVLNLTWGSFFFFSVEKWEGGRKGDGKTEHNVRTQVGFVLYYPRFKPRPEKTHKKF